MNFSELMSNGSKKIGQIAADIAGSKYAKAMVPGKENFLGEVNSYINSNNRTARKLRTTEINKSMFSDITDTISVYNEASTKPLDIGEDKIIALTTMMNGTDYSPKAFKKMTKTLKKEGMDKTTAQQLTNRLQENSAKIMNTPLDIDDYSKATKAAIYAKTYFGNPGTRLPRIGTAVGAYAGLSVGSRYLSGGTLTTNSSGNDDIAGIPFI